ncbi:MAG TPA: histidine kinase N-terminal 7TM domain-containing protein, partial [Lachnospiraceae bacterium]|nr:histidine kinase N-terminal 7TM domain-containing protein [Lachnospiraceae bacterium]
MEFGTGSNVAIIVLWNYFSILVNVVAFVIIYMKAKRSPSLKAFFLVQLSMLLWLVGKVLKTVSPNEELRWFFIVFYYAGICLLEVSFFDFAYIYGKNKPLKKPFRIAVYLLGFLQFMTVVTNPYHHLFYSVYGFWEDEFGALFYVHVVINYGFMIAAMILAGRKFKIQLSDKTRAEKNLISLAILVPLVLNFVYITRMLESLFRILHIQIFDITPIVYTWSNLIFVYATYKYEFFDLTPIMKHEIARKLDTPVLILNRERALLYANE